MQPGHQGAEAWEAGGDHARLVDRDGLLSAEAQDQMTHGDAVIGAGVDAGGQGLAGERWVGRLMFALLCVSAVAVGALAAVLQHGI